MSSPRAPRDAGLGPADLRLLDAIGLHDQALRAFLCTLARHGVALRQAEPARSQAWLDRLSRHPYFKGGQFLFDLLEWEDFMLDGPPPALLDADTARQALDRVAGALRQVAAHLQGQAPAGVLPIAPLRSALPPLESGFYLFNDVVLGAVDLLTRSG